MYLKALERSSFAFSVSPPGLLFFQSLQQFFILIYPDSLSSFTSLLPGMQVFPPLMSDLRDIRQGNVLTSVAKGNVYRYANTSVLLSGVVGPCCSILSPGNICFISKADRGKTTMTLRKPTLSVHTVNIRMMSPE